MFSVVNMGHGHPRIVSAAVKAVQEAAVVNIAFLNPLYAKLATRLWEVSTLVLRRTYDWVAHGDRYLATTSLLA